MFLPLLQKAGEILYTEGLMPLVKDTEESTHGNIAYRPDSRQFIMTTAGSHKGKLRTEDFVLVLEVDWNKGIIIYSAEAGKKPSTDVWLADAIFKAHPYRIKTIVHCHSFPKTPILPISISYPPLKRGEFLPLLEAVKSPNPVILKDHGCIATGEISILGPVSVLLES